MENTTTTRKDRPLSAAQLIALQGLGGAEIARNRPHVGQRYKSLSALVRNGLAEVVIMSGEAYFRITEAGRLALASK